MEDGTSAGLHQSAYIPGFVGRIDACACSDSQALFPRPQESLGTRLTRALHSISNLKLNSTPNSILGSRTRLGHVRLDCLVRYRLCGKPIAFDIGESTLRHINRIDIDDTGPGNRVGHVPIAFEIQSIRMIIEFEI